LTSATASSLAPARTSFAFAGEAKIAAANPATPVDMSARRVASCAGLLSGIPRFLPKVQWRSDRPERICSQAAAA
jgi:hypothetical protein